MKSLTLACAKAIVDHAENEFASGSDILDAFVPFARGGAGTRDEALCALKLVVADYYRTAYKGSHINMLEFDKYAQGSGGIALRIIADAANGPEALDVIMRSNSKESMSSYVTYLKTLDPSNSGFMNGVYERIGIALPEVKVAAQATIEKNGNSINWKMLSIGFVLSSIAVCIGLFRYVLVLSEKYPRLTNDDLWSIVRTFSPLVVGFSILFWLECSIGKKTKAKKAVYWLAFALIVWIGWFIFPPDMFSSFLLGGALACFVEAIVLVALVTWPLRYVAESLARRIKFLNDLEIYKMIQYSLISTWLLL